MNIRTAEDPDVAGILEIYNHAVLHDTATADIEPQSFDDRLNWLRLRRSAELPVLVAETEPGEIIGWAALNPYRSKPGYRFTTENSVYVAEQARGKGIGRALLTELLRQAEFLPIHAVVASIDATNKASLRLHASLGFRHCGRLPQLYTKFDRWLDVVYMVRLF